MKEEQEELKLNLKRVQMDTQLASKQIIDKEAYINKITFKIKDAEKKVDEKEKKISFFKSEQERVKGQEFEQSFKANQYVEVADIDENDRIGWRRSSSENLST